MLAEWHCRRVDSLMAVSPSVLGMAAHATHFVNLFAVAATWACGGP